MNLDKVLRAKILCGSLILCLGMFSTNNAIAQTNSLSTIHENVRQTPYPQAGQSLYLNPAPLLVPEKLKKSDFLQFQLSQQKDFSGENTILSKPVPWCMFNPHQKLSAGTWYWRFRSVSKSGENFPWSEIFRFEVTADLPVFVTPTFDALLKGMPQSYPRLFCFLDDELKDARQRVYSHPEYNSMITSAREGLAANYSTDTMPYNHVSVMVSLCEKLHTAYLLTQREVYANKMVQLIRWLLPDAANRRYMNFSELNNVGMKFEPKNQGVQYVDIQYDTNSVTFL